MTDTSLDNKGPKGAAHTSAESNSPAVDQANVPRAPSLASVQHMLEAEEHIPSLFVAASPDATTRVSLRARQVVEHTQEDLRKNQIQKLWDEFVKLCQDAKLHPEMLIEKAKELLAFCQKELNLAEKSLEAGLHQAGTQLNHAVASCVEFVNHIGTAVEHLAESVAGKGVKSNLALLAPEQPVNDLAAEQRILNRIPLSSATDSQAHAQLEIEQIESQSKKRVEDEQESDRQELAAKKQEDKEKSHGDNDIAGYLGRVHEVLHNLRQIAHARPELRGRVEALIAALNQNSIGVAGAIEMLEAAVEKNSKVA